MAEIKNAGYDIIAEWTSANGDQVVIGRKKNTEVGTKYVTWASHRGRDDYWRGHYHRDREEARDDFRDRILFAGGKFLFEDLEVVDEG